MPQEQSNFIQKCKETLYTYWEEIITHNIEEDYIDDKDLVKMVAESIRSKTKSYRYVLPTQLLAKLVDSSLDSKCLQAGRKPERGNFDARSLNNLVILEFEREQGYPLGGSPEPYVNNPLRVDEISLKHLEAQKNKRGWKILCKIFEMIESYNNPEFTEKLFKQTLLEIRRVQQDMEVTYPIPQRISLEQTMKILKQYLEPRTGGRRLQVVVYAIFMAMKNIWNIYDNVISAPVNAADAPGGRPADITCEKSGETVLAIEVKDRTVTLEMLESKIHSSREAHVRELMFLIRANQLTQDIDVKERAEREFTSGGNIYLLETNSFLENILALIGENGRQIFLESVCDALMELNLDFQDKKDWAELLSKC